MLRQFLLSVAVVGFLASCSSSGGTDREDAGQKKVFRYNQAEGISSLDPAFARNQANIWATTQMFNGLFELNEDLYPVASLADTWKISEDGTTYTFRIRKGVNFHDNEVFEGGKGREIKAADFVYSFKRILDPATASTGAWIFNDKVKRDENGEIAEDWIEAVDDYTLVLRLEKPFGPFLEILTMPYAFVVPQEAVEKYGKDFRTHPIGTGPFVFKSWEEGNNLILLRNENYWRKDENGRQLPHLDAVQVTFINDKNQEFMTFQQGKLDFMSGNQADLTEQILAENGEVKEELREKFVVQKVPYLNTEYIGFMMNPDKYENKNHPLLNKDFRKALSSAINREEMISYLLNGLGTPGTSGIVPEALPSFSRDKVKGYTYDPKKAAEYLKAAGFPEGKGVPELTLHTTIQSKPIIEYLQKQWEAIGVKVNIEINQVATHQEMVDNGKVVFFRGSWLGDYPDAENYLSMFYSGNFAPAGPNKTNFSNKAFDDLYNKARYESEGFNRVDMYQAMDNIIVEEAPIIVLFYDEVLRLKQNYVKGLEPNPMNIPRLERVDFASQDQPVM
ncbi:ABC transporter substrate-binding protein [Roseivirga sp. BDSF3-8]|uniref:ABC transporter substrate-binding protein n=1 Tax=Roseivirga sp. BDSF3-8 TaxID=3241598 RepID=UPI003531D273